MWDGSPDNEGSLSLCIKQDAGLGVWNTPSQSQASPSPCPTPPSSADSPYPKAPHLSLPAKSLSSGKRGQCWCLSHRLGLEKEGGLSFPGHLSEPSFLCPMLRALISITKAPIFSPSASSEGCLEALSEFPVFICEIQRGTRPLTSPCYEKRVLVFPHMTTWSQVL